MKKTWMIGAIAAAVMCSAVGAYAGLKVNSPAMVSPTFAIAGMSDTRASNDVNADVGCTVAHIAANAIIAFCSISDATGATKTCVSSDPTMIQSVASITANSTIRMIFDASGNCTQLYIDNYSAYRPITP